MIHVTPSITIDESEIQEHFVHASGPGGQNVNKVATAVQLRFNAANSPSIPEEVRRRLISLAGKRVAEDGTIIIVARRFRTQNKNREDATNRLVELIHKAAETPKFRRKTRPTLTSKIRRLESKHRTTRNKRLRGPVYPDKE
ncbi:alternative ribosome rescue aminoacyl-tRNA hydrolase ArfB [Chloroflexota bacterium]